MRKFLVTYLAVIFTLGVVTFAQNSIGETRGSARKIGINSKDKLSRLTEWLKKPLIPGEAGSIRIGWKSDALVDLASPKRRTHILDGDSFGGGHLWPGKPGKSVFPKDWNGDKIMHNVADVLTDPNIKWNKNKIVRGKQRYDATGVRDGVEIKVIVEPDGEGIVTAFPISGTGVVRNP